MQRLLTRFSILLVPLLLGALIAGCENKKKDDEVSEKPLREGAQLESTGVQYNDVRPSLSDDGTRLVFVSGRETTAEASSLKAFKAAWPDGAAPEALARVTGSDIGFEQDARLSPDGNWIVLTVQTGGKSDLYLQDYAGNSAPVRLTDDVLDESAPQFSPDSRLLVWIARDVANATSQAWGVAIGAGTAEDLALKKQMSTATEYVTSSFWLPGAYALGVAIQPATLTTGAVTLNAISFTELAEAQAAERKSWFDQLHITAAQPRAAGGVAFLARKVPVGTKFALAAGGGETPRKLPVESEVIFSYPAGATVDAETPPGHKILAIGGLTSDGGTGFVVLRSSFRCDPAATTYGVSNGIAAIKSSLTAASFFIPRTTATPGVFEVASTFCEFTRADGSTGRLDGNIADVFVNAAATETKLRALYVTLFSERFDERCTPKGGDPEIFALDVAGDVRTIHAVSANRAPIIDTPVAAGYGPCL